LANIVPEFFEEFRVRKSYGLRVRKSYGLRVFADFWIQISSPQRCHPAIGFEGCSGTYGYTICGELLVPTLREIFQRVDWTDVFEVKNSRLKWHQRFYVPPSLSDHRPSQKSRWKIPYKSSLSRKDFTGWQPWCGSWRIQRTRNPQPATRNPKPETVLSHR